MVIPSRSGQRMDDIEATRPCSLYRPLDIRSESEQQWRLSPITDCVGLPAMYSKPFGFIQDSQHVTQHAFRELFELPSGVTIVVWVTRPG